MARSILVAERSHTGVILMVYHEDYPWDVRVQKFCDTLLENDYKVHLLCNNKNKRAKYELLNGIHTHRIKTYRKRILGLPFPFNPLWILKMHRVIKDIKPALIIVRDIPLCIEAIVLAKLSRIPLVLDMAENYPEAVRIWKKTGEYKRVMRCAKNVTMLKVAEFICAKHADKILVVAEENRDRLIAMGLPPAKIELVRNTPVLSAPGKMSSGKVLTRREDGRNKVLVYVGGFQFHRGLVTLVESMRYVVNRVPEASLVMVGDGPAKESCEEKVRELDLQRNVGFTGYVSHEAVLDLIENAAIGVIPHIRSGHTDTTVPNKLFDYMACGKPVVVSDCKPLIRIVMEEGCGVVFKSGDAYDLANQVIRLLGKDLRVLQENGRRAVRVKYNWDRDKVALLDAVRETVVETAQCATVGRIG